MRFSSVGRHTFLLSDIQNALWKGYPRKSNVKRIHFAMETNTKEDIFALVEKQLYTKIEQPDSFSAS